MALPVTIPNAFANATASIPLSQLDTNFNTLANAVNGISDGSETLANVTATVANITTANVGALNTSGAVVFNDAGANVDFRVEGDTDANLLFVDASTDRVGVGTSTPVAPLHVVSGTNYNTFVLSRTNSSNTAQRTAINYRNYANNNSIGLIAGADLNGSTADIFIGLEAEGAGSGGIGANNIVFLTAPTYGGTSGERMRITSAGEVLVGGTTEIGSASGNLSLIRTTGGILNLFRDDTTVTSGDGFGAILFRGNDTTSNTPTTHAYISAAASGTHAAGDNPTDLVFATTPDGSATVAEKMRLTEAGYLRLAAGGIQFNGDTAAANALDDYEEGTITSGNLGITYTSPGTLSITYDARVGTYTKIGRVVYFTIDLRIQTFSKGTASGTLFVTGLPFAQRNTGGYDGARCTVQLYEWTYTTSPIIATVLSAGTSVAITRMVSNSLSVDIDDPRAGSIIWVTGFYFV